jgi:hypothetical protein
MAGPVAGLVAGPVAGLVAGPVAGLQPVAEPAVRLERRGETCHRQNRGGTRVGLYNDALPFSL